jgi:hypothetical protein
MQIRQRQGWNCGGIEGGATADYAVSAGIYTLRNPEAPAVLPLQKTGSLQLGIGGFGKASGFEALLYRYARS